MAARRARSIELNSSRVYTCSVQPTRAVRCPENDQQCCDSILARPGDLFCLVVLVLTFLAPALQAGMLEYHRATQHANSFDSPNALQQLASRSGHRPAASHHHPHPSDTHDHEAAARQSIPKHSGQQIATEQHEPRSAHSPPHELHDPADHTHPDHPANADPAQEHRHGDLVHSHDDALQELGTLAAGLVKTFVATPALSLPTVEYGRSESHHLIALFADPPRRIHIPPPRPFSV